MVRATLYLKIKAGHEDEFQQVWKGIAEQVAKAPGNVRQSLLRDPNDPSSFVLTSDWSDREKFHAFETSPEQDDLTAPIRSLRETARMTVLDFVYDIQGV